MGAPEQLRALAEQLMQRVKMLDHYVDTLVKTIEASRAGSSKLDEACSKVRPKHTRY